VVLQSYGQQFEVTSGYEEDGRQNRRASESNQVMTYRTGFEVDTPARTAVVVEEGTAGAGCPEGPEGVVHRPRTCLKHEQLRRSWSAKA
jgi:hypothetical protein